MLALGSGGEMRTKVSQTEVWQVQYNGFHRVLVKVVCTYLLTFIRVKTPSHLESTKRNCEMDSHPREVPSAAWSNEDDEALPCDVSWSENAELV